VCVCVRERVCVCVCLSVCRILSAGCYDVTLFVLSFGKLPSAKGLNFLKIHRKNCIFTRTF